MARFRLLKKAKNTLIYWSVLALVKVIRAVPEAIAQNSMAFLGRFAYRVAKGERKKVLRNLELIFEDRLSENERSEKAEKIFELIARNAVAALRIPNYFNNGIENHVTINGKTYLENAMAKGKGVLGLTGHIGSWELLAASISQAGFPLAVVGKKLYDKRIDKLLIGWRTAAGMIYISRDGAARRMLQWLKKGKMLGVLIDQDTKIESEFVPFMGHLARTPIAPMLLAQRLGAPIVPMAIHLQEDGKHIITILPELELEPNDKSLETRQRNLARCNAALEKLISIDDRQWVWMHERWKSKPAELVPSAITN
ncbi:MAG: hypothetical protein DWQ05_09060 [Calditrichaeota bacterium]|nr:MAG: hypothetical protein DWQ05_09060 [Calditrichota bacterium]